MSSYQILPFNDQSLAEALTLSIEITPDKVKGRQHYLYLRKYLGPDGVGAKLIVIEPKYVSKAYLSDYSNYYSTCFKPYERFCRRVHFFDRELTESEFQNELFSGPSKVLQDHYLGYIVIKPLPYSVIGPTLLKTYKTEENGEHLRFFSGCRDYKINFYGQELIINTLAFQEQDTAVSACASVSIWSAFHKTSELFRTQLPSPSEITKLAGNLFINTGRTYPNNGLDLTQVCRSIDDVGLVSELRSSEKFNSNIFLASRIIYSYVKAGIPVILLVQLGPKKEIGHALTVTGFHKPKDNEDAPKEEITLVADRIDTFYLHDDQLGPFSKYNFSGHTALQTSKWNANGTEVTEQAWIHSVVIPVYPKIRITFEDVFDSVTEMDSILFQCGLFSLQLEWDIYLQESNQYKVDLNALDLDKNTKLKKLTSNLPKYIWVARAQVNGKPQFDFIYDSTDIASGYFCINFVLLDPSVKDLLSKIIKLYPEFFIEKKGAGLGKETFEIVDRDLSE